MSRIRVFSIRTSFTISAAVDLSIADLLNEGPKRLNNLPFKNLFMLMLITGFPGRVRAWVLGTS